HGTSRLESRILRTHGVVLVPDLEEAAVVRVPPVATGPLTLLDDLVDRRECRVEASNGDQLRPVDQLGRRLGTRRSDEDGPLTELVSQPAQPALDAAVQMPDGQELLASGHELVLGQGLARRCRGDEAVS